MDADVHGGAVGLLALHTLDVDNVFGSVAGDNLAKLWALEVAANNLNTKNKCVNKANIHEKLQHPNHVIAAWIYKPHLPGPRHPFGWAWIERRTSVEDPC